MFQCGSRFCFCLRRGCDRRSIRCFHNVSGFFFSPSLLCLNQQSSHLLNIFILRPWHPSILNVLPASLSPSLHYLTNDIMPFYIPSSAHSLAHPLPTHILPFIFSPPISSSVCPSALCLTQGRARFHINRTLVTAFSAKSCLFAPCCNLIYSI